MSGNFVLSTVLTADAASLKAGFEQGGAAAQGFGGKLDQTADKARKAGRAIHENLSAGAPMQAAGRAVDALGASLERTQAKARQIGEALNRSLNIRSDFGGAQRAADILAYGQAMDALRAKYNPLYAAQQKYLASLREIAQAEKVGALSAMEAANARAATKADFADLVRQRSGGQPNRHHGESGGINRIQSMMFAHSAKASFETLASGGSPMQVALQQGPEIMEALALGSSSPGQILKSLASSIAGLVSPATLAIGALGGLGAALAIAGYGFAAEQKRIEHTVSTGLARGGGATLDAINAAADQNTGGALSRSEARTLATGFAGTGRISGEMIGQLTGLVPGMAALMGGDTEAAGKRLAQAFADPARGAEDLEKALGPLDDKTRQLIRSMQASGDIAGAQRALYQAIAESAKQAAEETGLWTSAVNALSNAWDGLGHAVAKSVTGGTLKEQLDDAKRQLQAVLADAQGGNAPRNLRAYGGHAQPPLQAAQAKVDRLQAEFDKKEEEAAKAKKEAADRLASQQAGGTVRAILPDLHRLQELKDMLASLNKAAASPDIAGGMGVSAEQNRQAIEAVTGARQTSMSAEEKARAGEQLAIDTINARTVAEKAAIATQRERLALAGQTIALAEQQKRAEAAAAAVVEKANADAAARLKTANDNAALAGLPGYRRQMAGIERKYRDLIDDDAGAPQAQADDRKARQAEIHAARQSAIGGPLREANRHLLDQVGALKLQQDAFGKSAGEAAKLAAAQEMVNRYNAAGVPITDQLRAAIEAYANASGKVAQASEDLAKKQQQLIGSLDQVRNTSRSAISGFVSDLAHGSSARDAFMGVAGKIGDQMIGNAADTITQSLFGENGKAGGGLFGDVLGGLFGKQAGLPSADITANVVNVNGAVNGLIDKAVGGFNPDAAGGKQGGLARETLKGLGPTSDVNVSPLAPVGGMLDPASGMAYLRAKGLSDVQAAALLGNYKQESGFNPLSFNAKEGAYGLGQWRLDRRQALNAFAKERGLDVATPKTQLDFGLHEMRTAEAAHGAAFFRSTTLNEANNALKRVIRYGDDSQGTRLANAQGLLRQYGGGAPATALAQGQAGQGQVPGLQQLQASLGQLGASARTVAPSLNNVVSSMGSLPSPLSQVAANANQAGSALGQGGGGLAGALQSLLGALFGKGGGGGGAVMAPASLFADGGRIEGYADGGRLISGPGTGRSDSILATTGRKLLKVSNGESINTAKATQDYWPLIDAMNKGALNKDALPAFADGGEIRLAGPAPAPVLRNAQRSGAAAAGGPAGGVTMNIHNYSGQPAEQRQTTDENGRTRLDVFIGNHLADQIQRPGTETSRALQAQYGLRRQVTRR